MASFKGLVGEWVLRLAPQVVNKIVGSIRKVVSNVSSKFTQRLNKTFPSGSKAQADLFKSMGIAGKGVNSTSTALIPYVAPSRGLEALGFTKKLLVNGAAIVGTVDMFMLIDDLLSDLGDDATPELVDYVNELTTDLRSLNAAAEQLEQAGIGIRQLAGDPKSVEPVDAIAYVEANKQIETSAIKAKAISFEATASEVKEKQLRLEALSRLLGLSPRNCLRAVRLLREVDDSYQALIDLELI